MDASSSTAAAAKKRPRKSSFKGVVPQVNGNWGGYIYAHCRRIWLGTFKTEEEAATGYDRAALKLRTYEHLRGVGNLPLSQILTAQEMAFQNSYTAEAVIDMIRDRSYQAKFDDFRKGFAPVKVEPRERPDDNRIRFRRLFQKDLTPSDVGKMNRVVIPKKCAVKFFPQISEERGAVEVSFYDRELKTWTFRYCYWRSSGSYVFTTGWNEFVREKELAANDTIDFSSCEGFGDNLGPYFLIDVIKNRNDGGLGQAGVVVLGQNVAYDQVRQVGGAERKSFKLFGVQIFEN